MQATTCVANILFQLYQSSSKNATCLDILFGVLLREQDELGVQDMRHYHSPQF